MALCGSCRSAAVDMDSVYTCSSDSGGEYSGTREDASLRTGMSGVNSATAAAGLGLAVRFCGVQLGDPGLFARNGDSRHLSHALAIACGGGDADVNLAGVPGGQEDCERVRGMELKLMSRRDAIPTVEDYHNCRGTYRTQT